MREQYFALSWSGRASLVRQRKASSQVRYFSSSVITLMANSFRPFNRNIPLLYSIWLHICVNNSLSYWWQMQCGEQPSQLLRTHFASRPTRKAVNTWYWHMKMGKYTYIHTHITMGTKMASSYFNLVLVYLEDMLYEIPREGPRIWELHRKEFLAPFGWLFHNMDY